MTENRQPFNITGKRDGERLASRVLEEQIQQAVDAGHRSLAIHAFGQHGIGGRLWKTGGEPVHLKIKGHAGQRVGSMGYPGTTIDVLGPVSDDVGWLNAGATITVHGHASNGAANGMAQGKVYVAGNIGARGMTMTKNNPRFEPPQLWVLGSAGDYFAEFMAGGVAVICGHDAQNPENVLGYRPMVGMVGGRVLFRGPQKGFSHADARMMPVDDDTWKWLVDGLERFLTAIDRLELRETLAVRDAWQLIIARSPQEKKSVGRRSMADFRRDVWDNKLGRGGIVGDLTDIDRSPIPLITHGNLRRFVPVWENRKFKAPCESTCPSGIPVQDRWRLVREGRVDEAVDLALAFTPFPASVCGYLCPHPCMTACTKGSAFMTPVDVSQLGRASIDARLPELPPLSGKRIAVVGGGPAGISTAWQLRRMGHEAVVFDNAPTLGGKIASAIPSSRIPADVVEKELARAAEAIPHVHLQQRLSRSDTIQLIADYDFVILAAGAQKPRTLPIPGKERLITAMDFLTDAKHDRVSPGNRVVIIGAGNVGCDVATEAARLGAGEITLLDVQEPASFGKEREDAESVGAVFRWPVFTRRITERGVELESGELIPADTVVVSIGDAPDLDFLPDDVATERGFVMVNEDYQTSNPKVYAIGDVVRPGLLTDAIGAGRRAAETISEIMAGKRPGADRKMVIDINRISLEYLDPRIVQYEDMEQCGSQCASCGSCRDCGICVAMCPEAAISRKALEGPAFEYVVDPERCIGCGFCAGACPCGIWDLVENTPMG
ncbi:pyridine nucleotide-disulfide oxidoreductase [Desulfosarcina alkanivorans]|uniref:Pyridine nucleotide-disulfide oxidoreductase n=1 Tax=Desulfosarcina alkanivorans TaxID=571177 RepID=A0A5K7YN77_9BACT|nr:FAD-dependent oxidoreductase [Desulfosarcina alkanivorans]BBO69329.1 pyridine nucleotide-disulfide oxidoreductase [Desulfosarcina alkanivorans]